MSNDQPVLKATSSKEDTGSPVALSTNEVTVTKTPESVAKDAKQPLEDETTPSVSSSASSVTLVQDGLASDSSTSPPSSGPCVKPCAIPEATPPKPVRGWLSRPPFTVPHNKNWLKTHLESTTYWSDLTLREKLEFRRSFLKIYLSETRQCLPYVRKFFLTIYRISPWRVVMLLALNVLSGLLPALTLHARGNFVMMLQEGLEKKNLDMRAIMGLLARQLLATAITTMHNELPSRADQYLNSRLQGDLQIGLLRGFLELDISEMTDPNIEMRFHDAQRLMDEQGVTMFTKQLAIIGSLTSIAACSATLATLVNRKSWPVLALMASMPLLNKLTVPLLMMFKNQELPRYSPVRQELALIQRERQRLVRIAQDSGARRELLIFGAKDWILKRYTQLSEMITRLRDAHLVTVDLKGAQQSLVDKMFPQLDNGIKSLIYLFVAFNPDYFDMPISQLTFLESAVHGIYSSVRGLQRYLSEYLIKDMFKIRNLFECIDMKSKVARPENPAPYISHPNGMKIQVKDVSFTYDKELPPVLEDLNFTIEPGEIVSIVGYNGSGKSTLIRLLTLFEKPTGGTILINGKDVAEYEPDVVRANMSILFQDFEKYSELSVRDNVGIGNSNLGHDLEIIKGASKETGAHDFVASFASYYLTRVFEVYRAHPSMPSRHYPPAVMSYSEPEEKEWPFTVKVLHGDPYRQAKARGKTLRWEEKPLPWDGTIIRKHEPEQFPLPETVTTRGLSGGEWQRIALARSFMKIREADLLILDEPSSALDPQAEYEVFKNLLNLRKNKTTIYISHRFHTVRAATKILLFDKGKLEEMGTHSELMQIEGGKYAHLFRLQSDGYAEISNNAAPCSPPPAPPQSPTRG